MAIIMYMHILMQGKIRQGDIKGQETVSLRRLEADAVVTRVNIAVDDSHVHRRLWVDSVVIGPATVPQRGDAVDENVAASEVVRRPVGAVCECNLRHDDVLAEDKLHQTRSRE
jgi:hypothetical protein